MGVKGLTAGVANKLHHNSKSSSLNTVTDAENGVSPITTDNCSLHRREVGVTSPTDVESRKLLSVLVDYTDRPRAGQLAQRSQKTSL